MRRLTTMLAGLCLAFCLAAVTASPAQAQPTGASVGESLMSGDPARIDAALATVRAGAGAYPPILFMVVTRALADRNDLQEAAKWQVFGEFRISADLIMLSQDTGGLRDLRPTALALGAYNAGKDKRVTDFIAAMSPSERESLLNEAVRLDAQAPRLYPPSWAREMRDGSNSSLRDDWTIRSAIWPQRAMAVRAPVTASLRNDFAQEMGLRGVLGR